MNSPKPKIAILIDWYLPGTKAGGPVRSVYSLVNLLKDYFDFFLITSNHDLGNSEPYKTISPDQWFDKDGIHYYYFRTESLNLKNVMNVIRQADPELVYLNSFWSVNFSIRIVLAHKLGKIKPKLLLAPRGMLGQGALTIKSFKKQVYLRLSRFFRLYKNVPFHATNSGEKKDIESCFPDAFVSVAPNINALPASRNVTVKESNKLLLFYLSMISPVKNLHYALALLSEIPSQYQVIYDIYGNIEDFTYWEECKKIISRLPDNVIVNYKQELPFDKIQPIISKYHVLLLPTLNENFGHSIVESMLSGCPVIISDQTPWKDLESFNAGYSLSLHEPGKFIDCIVQMAQMTQGEFSEKSAAATSYITNKINLPLITGQYINMFNERIKN